MAAKGGGASKSTTDSESTSADTSEETPKIIVLLDKACLETVKTKKGFELLSCDDHLHLHGKIGKDPAESRPDITHQLLMTLLDSPLNKAGKLKVYIRTQKRVLIDINPKLRVPRTYKRFAGLMVQLMYKLRIRAAQGAETLMKVIKNPIEAHLPPGTVVVGTHMKGELTDPIDLVPKMPEGKPACFVIGAMARGFIEGTECEKLYSFSKYALTANVACSKLLCAYERHLGIL